MMETGATRAADQPAPRPRFELGWYNGWSPDERRATIPVQKAAIACGELARPKRCSVCLIQGSRNWKADDAVWLHDERYDRPLEAFPICRRCHRLLHGRFDDPGPWLALVAEHARGGEWFEMLSMDPESRHRPFDATYPRGLPGGGLAEHTGAAPTTHLEET